MYLAINTKKVIDVKFAPAVDEIAAIPGIDAIEADPESDPPLPGRRAIAEVPAVPAIPEIAEESHLELRHVYLERQSDRVAKDLGNDEFRVYYHIEIGSDFVPILKAVREKSRAQAPSREVVTIETNDGIELGSAEI